MLIDEIDCAEYDLKRHEQNDGNFHGHVNIVSSLCFVVFFFKPQQSVPPPGVVTCP